MAFTHIKEIADLFDEELVLVSTTHKKLENPLMHVAGTRIGESFGIELRYKAEKAGEFVSVYVVLQNRMDSIGRPYPFDLIIAADSAPDRLNNFFDVYFERNKELPPFLSTETISDSNKRARFDNISKLEEGTTLQELTDLLEERYCTQ